MTTHLTRIISYFRIVLKLKISPLSLYVITCNYENNDDYAFCHLVFNNVLFLNPKSAGRCQKRFDVSSTVHSFPAENYRLHSLSPRLQPVCGVLVLNVQFSIAVLPPSHSFHIYDEINYSSLIGLTTNYYLELICYFT